MIRRLVLVTLALLAVAAFITSVSILRVYPEPTHVAPDTTLHERYCGRVSDLVTTGWEHPGGDQVVYDDEVMIASRPGESTIMTRPAGVRPRRPATR